MTIRISTPSDEAFFESRVFRPDTPCWNWRAYVGKNGYGKWVRSDRQAAAHRVAYELLVGPIPDGMQVHHTCFNRSCVNPVHLELVTPKENQARSLSVSVSNAAKTHCAQGHVFDAENTVVTKRGRVCRICRNDASKLANASKRRARGQTQRSIECKHGHVRTPENTRYLSGGTRRCRDCDRATKRRSTECRRTCG